MNTPEAPGKKGHPILVTLLGTFVASAVAVLGIVLISVNHARASYGLTMFIILPLATGMVIACFSRSVRATGVSIVLSILVCFALLLLCGLEGVVCVLMAFPLFFVCTVVGVLIGIGISRLVRKGPGSKSNLLLLPLIGASSVFGAGQIEDRLAAPERTEVVTTTRNVAGTLEEVWTRILSIEEVSGDKPFLLRIGLPVPTSCTLEGTGVGARRVCHFENGVIEEEVTNWEPRHRLDMRILRSTLPGRHWLHFESASYELQRVSPSQTRLTRTTTISSKLRPAWYWRFFERMGVEAEHRYLFESLF
jgi:hypothetical protein